LYGFAHITSSPGHPSGNGEAERAVRTVKQLLKGAKDPYLALLSYRSSPIKNGYSPAELLMGRKLRTTVPMVPAKLLPKTPDMEAVQQFEQTSRQKLKSNFDKRHAVQQLPELQRGDEVYVPDRKETATVTEKSNPTSYKVQGDSQEVRRNRVQLTKMPEDAPATPLLQTPPQETRSSTPNTASGYVTRYGRTVKTPERFKN